MSGKREWSSSSIRGTAIEKSRRAEQVAHPGDSLAHAEAGVALEIGDRALAQLVTWRRSGESGQCTADADHPVVDQHGHLLGKIFLEAQPDQVAPGEFQELSSPGADGQQAAPRSTAYSADREDRTPFLDPAQMTPSARRSRRARTE